MGFVAADEMAHAPGPDQRWQESLVLCWFDAANGVGGFHRVGHEVNEGLSNVWCGIVTRSGNAFRRVDGAVAFSPEDHSDVRFAVDGHAFSYPGHLAFSVSEPEVELELVVEDFYPVTDFYPPARDHSPFKSHYESSGRVTGRVRLGDEKFEVDGLCHRDHSWGSRDWASILSHRWVSGSCGPDLSFSSLVLQGPDGGFLKVGAVIRDGAVTVAEDLETVAFMEADGVSHRGGRATWTLPGGAQLIADCEPVNGVLFNHREYLGVDAICRATFSDGHEGFCVFEVSNGVRRPVPVALGAVTASGLTLADR